MKTYTHRASVSIPDHGRFPVDMLRYDQCYPCGEQDSSRIEASLAARTAAPFAVCVERVTTARDWNAAFTRERWESFGARIHVV